MTLPPTLAEQVDAFRQASGAASESDALKTLIEQGFRQYDKEKDLFDRCKAATDRGTSLGDVINYVLDDHPRVDSAQLNATRLTVRLKRGDLAQSARFVFDRASKVWQPEVWEGGKKGWAAASFDSAGEVSDDIPF